MSVWGDGDGCAVFSNIGFLGKNIACGANIFRLLASVLILGGTKAVKAHDKCFASTVTSDLVCVMCAPDMYCTFAKEFDYSPKRQEQADSEALPVGLEQLLHA